MARHLARRLIGAVPLVLGTATLVFFVMNLAPGDPASTWAAPGVSPESIDQMRRNMGLDRPMHERYVRWMGSMLRGDFGVSLVQNEPVRSVIARRLPNTLLLSGTALALAFLGGIAVGVWQAVRRDTATDRALSVGSLFFYSMPSFWLALMMVLVFSLYARNVWGWPFWFPASGMVSVDHAFLSPAGRILDRLRHLVLPALSLALVLAAGIARFMRASMLETLGTDFVRAARARGLSERAVVLRHAFRNALIPIVTLFGLLLPLLLSGAVFVEAVFAWPGMGKLLVDAITQRDYPVVMAGAFVFTIVVVLGNLAADLLYPVVDPRIQHGSER